jgi:8-oxo-dGTP diphosphatase
MYLYRAEGLSGEISECDEGELAWIEKDLIPSLPMWEGDRLFLDMFFDRAPFFTMSLTYEGDTLVSHKVIKERVV